ncbi:ATP phosphoribosyltransferase [Hyphomicrobiales bacterium]|nr:ATP phosphoribosyltransferase [Hyphomicrobiales bacterium]
MSDKIIIGIPNKGRLQEKTFNLFMKSGLEIIRNHGDREYYGKMDGIDNVDVVFLSPREISMELNGGTIDIGITGLDLIYENIYQADKHVKCLAKLDYGFADVVVAIPISWIDVDSIIDLDDIAFKFRMANKRRLRIATKYPNISREFFSKKGFADYLLVESLGATEGSPAYGSAEAIIDITSTGSTLLANELKTLVDGTILKSESCLFVSVNAKWTVNKKKYLEELFGKISMQINIDKDSQKDFLENLS